MVEKYRTSYGFSWDDSNGHPVAHARFVSGKIGRYVLTVDGHPSTECNEPDFDGLVCERLAGIERTMK